MRSAIAALVLAPLLAGCVGNDDVVQSIGWSTEDGSIRVLPGDPVTFWVGTSVTSAEGAPPLDVSWHFGDGSGARGNPVTHAYSHEGRYAVFAAWNEQNISHSLAVDLEKAIVGTAPADLWPAAEEGRYDAHPFDVKADARAIDILVEADLGPRETLHLRLMGPDGQEVLQENTQTGTIQVSTETVPPGPHEVQIWVRDALQERPVSGYIAVAY